jgi:hypothetical protein
MIELAETAAEQGLVLLKNARGALPLSAPALAGAVVAVLGPSAIYWLKREAGRKAPLVIPITRPGPCQPLSTPFLASWADLTPTHRGFQ